MCFQVPLALVAGVKAGGDLLRALQARASAEASAAVAENTATVALQRAGREAEALREQGAVEGDTRRARFGKAGIDPAASGSAAAVIGESARIAERDARDALHAGQATADNARAQAALARSRGRQALLAGMIRAGSTLLTGLSRPGGGSGYRQPIDLLG